MSQAVFVERDERGVRLTLDRPPLNILDLPTLEQLDRALAQVAATPGLQWVIVEGGGLRAFSAGVAIEDHTPDRIPALLEVFHRSLRRLFALAPPTVAAVDGHCLGGGLELALSCDMIVATERSTFGQPEIELGCFPPVAAALLPHRVGSGVALDLILTGRKIDAAEAERLGIVTRRVADGELERGLRHLRSELGSKSAAVLQLAKKAARAAMPDAALFGRALAEAERIYLEELPACADMAEGVNAFLEKRPPEWRHA